jgi:hypothetical protein
LDGWLAVETNKRRQALIERLPPLSFLVRIALLAAAPIKVMGS